MTESVNTNLYKVRSVIKAPSFTHYNSTLPGSFEIVSKDFNKNVEKTMGFFDKEFCPKNSTGTQFVSVFHDGTERISYVVVEVEFETKAEFLKLKLKEDTRNKRFIHCVFLYDNMVKMVINEPFWDQYVCPNATKVNRLQGIEHV